MDITEYHEISGSTLVFSEQQGSDFAKLVAGDFNPLHDVGNKRFCVPGDLLFSVLLHRYGVHQETQVQFAGMVGASTPLALPDTLQSPLYLNDARERTCLTMTTSGEVNSNKTFAEALCSEYVRYSGQTFPDILVKLMRREGVMINPARPLVIYKDMQLHLDRFSAASLTLEPVDAQLNVDGKKGSACLQFSIKSGGETVGNGEKNMVLSGLREFDDSAMAALVEDYNQRKQNYSAVIS